MSETLIKRLHLANYRQFRDTTLDFTDGQGRALRRVCLIGRNGTGKTTTLCVLASFVRTLHRRKVQYRPVAVEWELDGEPVFTLDHPHRRGVYRGSPAPRQMSAILHAGDQASLDRALGDAGCQPVDASGVASQALQPGRDLLATVQASGEVLQNQGPALTDVPGTSLNDALALMKEFPVEHFISDAHITGMWNTLIYLVKKRDNDRQAFEVRPDNLHRTKAALIEEFERDHPPVLEALGELWNRLLAPAGLEFDVAGASIPVQLNENLHAYIKRRDSGERVPYKALSAGMRNLMFRVGHLLLLFWRRHYESAFVFVDEPEASLFPDFLYELMPVFDDIVGERTQLFVATHSPIVAAQFQPEERIILDWDADGFVVASKGRAPKGDDPNDLLTKDFGLTELLGPEGRSRWREYQQLRHEIRSKRGTPEADELLERASRIAREYGFAGAEPTP